MKARRGRPPTGTIHGKSAVLTTRIRPELRDRLNEAAIKSDHALSQEVERRLTDSFIQDRRMEDAFGSVEQFWLMRLISLAMQLQYVPFCGIDDWKRSPEHFEVMLKTVTGILESLRPGPMPETSAIEKQMMDYTSKNLPIVLWRTVTEANESLRLNEGSNDDHLAAMLKRKIGKVAEDALKNAEQAMPSEEEWKRRRDAAYEEQSQAMNKTEKRRKK